MTLEGSQTDLIQSMDCSSKYNKSYPNEGIMTCKETMNVSVKWQHGDR